MEMDRLLFLITSLYMVSECSGFLDNQDPNKSAARKALEYVEKIRNNPDCKRGTNVKLNVTYNHTIWSEHAMVAVRTSNLLTKHATKHGGNLTAVSEKFLYDLMMTNVEGNSLIFGSGVYVEPHVFQPYKLFCPYAFKKGGKVYAHDLSLGYDYFDSEYIRVLRERNWDSTLISRNNVTYRSNTQLQTQIHYPVAVLEDGHWTLPYYDCGGGDIWMVTYSAPIFSFSRQGKPIFRAIAGIDIELTHIDINQCDQDQDSLEEGTGPYNIFRGTHRCQPTTKCVPEPGKGFIPGAYRCYCEDSFYFPNTNIPESDKYYPGSSLENLNNSAEDVTTVYKCLKCAEGCNTCTDDSPCLYSHILPLRITLLALSIILIVLIACTSLIVVIHRDKKVIKSASPIFLQLICAGSILMVIPMLINYIEATDITCLICPWPRHVGFCLAYGGLLLKTWRITAIFKVKSAKKLKLPDKVLAKRLLPFVGVTLAYLAAWTGLLETPSELVKTTRELKFINCCPEWWFYAIFIAESCFLLWGAYLCFVVRKAPSLFNESKYITWAIYNNIILGSFIIVARKFMAIPRGPDVIYVFDFFYTQVCATSLVCLIFLPKFWVIHKNINPKSTTDTDTTATRQKELTAMVTVTTETEDKQIQVELIKSDVDLQGNDIHGTPSQCASSVLNRPGKGFRVYAMPARISESSHV